MARYARGKHAVGQCQRSGKKVPYRDLVYDGYYPNLLVAPEWYEPAHPQEHLPAVHDPVALRKASPEHHTLTLRVILSMDDMLNGAALVCETGTYVTVSDAAALDFTGDFTLEGRVKLPRVATSDDGSAGRAYVFDKRTSGSNNANYALLAQLGDLGTDPNAVGLVIGDGSSQEVVESSLTISDRDWHNLSVAVDASENTVHFYLDVDPEHDSSHVVDSQSFTTTLTANAQDLILGGHLDSAGAVATTLPVWLHELRVWSERRTRAQVADKRDERLSGTESGLVAVWDAKEGRGSTLGDGTGNHDGTITEARWTNLP